MLKKDVRVQRNIKDNLFCDLFSQKDYAISLYNALNGTNYDNPDDLEIVTLSNTIYLHQKNDVSVLFQNQLDLWEQQSTLNYNMPLRGLIYFAHNIDGLLAEQKINLNFQTHSLSQHKDTNGQHICSTSMPGIILILWKHVRRLKGMHH